MALFRSKDRTRLRNHIIGTAFTIVELKEAISLKTDKVNAIFGYLGRRLQQFLIHLSSFMF